MTELLAPAGTMEALVAAVNAGCDAVYLGMSRFGARAYATNFDFDTIKDAIRYCHLYNVKIHVTMNTIVFEDEIEEAFEQIKKLYQLGIDAIIIQDIALLDYVRRHCSKLEAHASTQMGLDDTYGAFMANKLGADRVVLGRECSIDKLIEVKKTTNIPVEAFGHGALCVSFSGNCLMSGLIGYRSGNRGRCVGSCRKPYELINKTTNESLGTSYILSMKDLATIDNIDKLKELDSLKIEGRMKEPTYVANVVKHYRYALDNGKMLPNTYQNLEKTFNRTFTKGYIFGEDKKNIVNISRPNHVGYYAGYISNRKGNIYEITLTREINQNDVIRIESTIEINYPLTKMYDEKGNLINSANKKVYIKMTEKAKVGDLVYVTRDTKYLDELERTMNQITRRIPIDFYLTASIGEPLNLTAVCDGISVSSKSDFIVEQSNGKILVKEKLFSQLDRIKDTPYVINHFEVVGDSDAFVPTSKLNELRRDVVEKLNEERLKRDTPFIDDQEEIEICTSQSKRGLSVFCTTNEQYEAAKELGIETIYYDNYIRRNEAEYKDNLKTVLVGGYNGIGYYQNKDVYLVSDFSLNVVNSRSVYLLHKNNVKRVTISHELNKIHLEQLINKYKNDYNSSPNLEMIVYGHAHLLTTKYCPLKVNGLCGQCKKNRYTIKDNYGEFPIISHDNCHTTIVNGRALNLLDEINYLPHEITKLRIQLTIESKEEAKRIIKMALEKINGSLEKTFNSEIQTRGHYNKEIL